jgi:23S rRNA pseudouridine1911/1915/1917 synthase
MPEPGSFILVIKELEAGTRLDTHIASHINDCSRSYVAKLINDGYVEVNRQKKKPGYRVQFDDKIIVSIPPPEAIDITPELIALDILYEDQDLILINKPAGMVVHPAPGHASGTLVNALLHHCTTLKGIGGEIRPGIVHRLDKDTSGVMVAAKSEKAHHSLTLQFKCRQVHKRYLALVHGSMPRESGSIQLPIGRHPIHRKKMSTSSRHARDALTEWKVIKRFRFSPVCLLSVQLKTGRTHQIRVHCAAIGHPLLGDQVYGNRKKDVRILKEAKIERPLKRQQLHASRLHFTHPVTGKLLTIEAPLAPDMAEMIQSLEAANK